MSTTTSIFQEFSQDAITEIIAAMRREDAYATGKSARSLIYEANESKVVIYGGAAFKGTDRLSRIETGRGPTRNSEGGKLYPAILEWLRAKQGGIRKGDEGRAFVITRNIHEHGTALWKRGQMRDIVQGVFSPDRFAGLYRNLGAVLYREVESEVVKKIKEGFAEV